MGGEPKVSIVLSSMWQKGGSRGDIVEKMLPFLSSQMVQNPDDG